MSNTPSFRLPFTLPDDVHPAVRDAIRYIYNGLTNHEQAFAQIGKVSSGASAAPTTNVGTTASIGGDPPWVTGGIRTDLEFVSGRSGTSTFGLDTVNTGATAATDSSYAVGAYSSGINQQAGTTYTITGNDYSGVVIFNTPSAVTASLNSIVPKNFNCWIYNRDSGQVTLQPTMVGDRTPTINGAASITLAANSISQVFWDGQNWYAVSSNTAIVEINGVVVGDPNFNDTTPAAEANHILVKWQTSASDVSAEVPYGSSSVFGVVKVDNTTITASAGVISAVTPTAVNFADSETPAGAIDGANKTFTLANAPNPALSLQLFLEPMGFFATLEIQGIDYTLSGPSITMTTAPSVGQVIRAWYRH